MMFAQAALDTAVQSDKAPALFDAAADKFQEVSAHGARTALPHCRTFQSACKLRMLEDLCSLPPHFPHLPQRPSMKDHIVVKQKIVLAHVSLLH